MERDNVTITTPTKREVVVTRTFAAKPVMVFDALTIPELVRQWCVPPGWSMDVCEIDLRVGGRWRFKMRQPGGKEIGQLGVYLEVVRAQRIVNTENWEDWDAGESLVTTDLADHGDGTLFMSTICFPSKEVRDIVLKSGLEHSVGPLYAQLEAVLAGNGKK